MYCNRINCYILFFIFFISSCEKITWDLKEIKSKPILSSVVIDNVDYNSVKFNAKIISNGGSKILKSGICFSENINPNLNSSIYLTDFSIDKLQIVNLKQNTKYYLKSFAINNIDTTFSEEINFKTTSITNPIVKTYSPNVVSSTEIYCTAEINYSGGAPILKKGFCISMNNDPRLNKDIIVNGLGNTVFTCTLNTLDVGVKYYIRAFAINIQDTGYGQCYSFIPSNLPQVSTILPQLQLNNTCLTGGVILYDGGTTITLKGVCWSENAHPTISDNYSTDGSGNSTYSTLLINLKQNTKYYIRAYAINGLGINYGQEYSIEN